LEKFHATKGLKDLIIRKQKKNQINSREIFFLILAVLSQFMHLDIK